MSDAVCRCGAGPHATEPDCCARGHVLVGNRRTVTHGLYSFRMHGAATLPPDLKVSVDQLRDELVAAQGGLEELSREPVRAEAVRVFVDCAAGRRLLMNEVIRKGIDTAAGKRAYDGMLQTTDRMLRVAALLGTERRSRQVQSLTERFGSGPAHDGDGGLRCRRVTRQICRSLWLCVERAADLEEQLRRAANEAAAWQAVARAGIAALDREIARRRGEEREIPC